MDQYILGLSSGIRAGTLWLGLIFVMWSIDPCLSWIDDSLLLYLLYLITLIMHTGKFIWKFFLQALGEKVWQAIEVSKPKEASVDWDEATIKAAKFNSRALNAFFSAVTNEEFKKISSTEVAKEAWTILETTYEGAKAVKTVKFQRLTSSFEEIRMEGDETFDEFYAKLKDIVNSAFNLGESIAESKIVRKFRPRLIELTSFKPKLLIRFIMNKPC